LVAVLLPPHRKTAQSKPAAMATGFGFFCTAVNDSLAGAIQHGATFQRKDAKSRRGKQFSEDGIPAQEMVKVAQGRNCHF
jgi:hypothetical protein